MATTHPELAAEWHPVKNGKMSASEFVSGTNKRIWWVCEKGHEWAATGNARSNGSGCPVCGNKKLETGYNDMVTTHPHLVSQWNFAKNVGLEPSQVIAGSNKKVWWVCDKGHEWQISPNNRSRGSGCPVCEGLAVVVGVNDLATTHPELAAEWHPTKNGDVTPSQIVAGSGKRFWWLCDKGHEWRTSGDNRSNGKDCPYCSGRNAWPGYNDMATTYPELAAEWHPTKNGEVTPSHVVAGSNKKFWWLCDLGHEWQAVSASRLAGRGCPTCAVHGYDPNKPATLYFLANRSLYARKVGITNQGTSRLADFGKAGWRQVLTVDHPSGHLVRAVEASMLKWLRVEHALPQHVSKSQMRRTGGWTETFSEEGPSDYEVIDRIRAEFARLTAEG
jgi:Probable Zinc-ribbon domain